MKKIILYILFVFQLNYVFAQHTIKFKHLGAKDGLSQSWIKCIFQDSDGFLWFGTEDGLNKYNGSEFIEYHHQTDNNIGLIDNIVNTLYEDKHRNLWIGTKRGICIFNLDKNQFINYSILENREISKFIEYDENRLLIGHNAGLSLINIQTKSLEVSDHLTKLSKSFHQNYVADILKDKNGYFWVCTFEGLFLSDEANNRIIQFRHKENDPTSITENEIHSICQDDEERIWLGTTSSGLILMTYPQDNPLKPVFINYRHNPDDETTISKGSIYSIYADKNKSLWIGTENGGLNKIDLNNFDKDHCTFNHYIHNPADNSSISSNSIYALFCDRESTLWIGTYGGGINFYNKILFKFTHYKNIPNDKNSICNNHINVIYEEKNHLWFGTEGGISILNKNTGQYVHYSHDPHNNKSIGSNAVLSFCRDKRGNMWIGTWAGGLNLFDEKAKTFKRYLHDPKDNTSIGNNNISCITCTKDGSLWIATMGGGLNVYNYENDSFKKYTTDFRTPNAVFSNDWIQSVYENSYGELWISTISAVDIFNRKKEKMIKFYHDPDNPKSISYYVAIMIFEDSKRNMWIGTANGLNLYNRADSSFIHYHEGDGLPNNCIRGICEDDQGNLWISTNNGISKFVNGINHPADPIFQNYSLDDGLQGNEFKSRCVLKGKDGQIYFGGNNGYNVFHPDSIYENNKIPDIVITDFLLFNKPVEIGSKSSPLKKHLNVCREVRLNYNQSVFSIQYASLNYLAPKENQYAFMLEGFEKEWNFVGKQRLATYTNLNPGEYIFRVKGSNNDGIWNDEGISVKITIVPPIWKTTWAYIIYVLIFGGIIFTIYRFQIKRIQMRHELILEHRHAEKLEEINEMKSRFFSNITHEFRTPLTLIMAPVKQFIAGDMTENFKKTCQMILRNSEKLYQLINQLLDLSKIEAGHMPLKTQELNIIPLVRTTVMLFSSLAERKKIELRFKVLNASNNNKKSIQVFVDQGKIEEIISNLISNALKFTPENGVIEVSLQKKQNDVELIIKDNGIGIPEESVKNIFNRFYRVKNPHLENGHGFGIGLALTKELVELHHGSIRVDTQSGKGTTFTAQFPLGKEHLQEHEIISKYNTKKYKNLPYLESEENEMSKDILNVSGNHSPLVLIVEDNEDILHYLSNNLKKDYQILQATDGQSGIVKATNNIPDLIVSDVLLPQKNGFQLCEKIKTNELTSHIPIILLTARTSKESLMEGLETGADDYITKPFEMQELKARIRNLIEQRKKLKKKYNKENGLRPSDITTNSMDEKFLEKALDMIEKNISNPNFGVEQFAQGMALSRVQLYRKIKAITGQTSTEFIRIVRLNRAAQLLKQKYDNISQIAYEVGFQSPSYFSKSFYKHFNVYPSDY